jgi:hypothetical protein
VAKRKWTWVDWASIPIGLVLIFGYGFGAFLLAVLLCLLTAVNVEKSHADKV